MRECLDILRILATDKEVLEQAYALGIIDFEDALQRASAERNGLDAIVTRDPNGFIGSPIHVLSPLELVAHLRATN